MNGMYIFGQSFGQSLSAKRKQSKMTMTTTTAKIQSEAKHDHTGVTSDQ